MTKKTTTATATKNPPECWADQQLTKSKKKLYGIWAKYNVTTKTKIEKECNQKEKKTRGAKKRKVTR